MEVVDTAAETVMAVAMAGTTAMEATEDEDQIADEAVLQEAEVEAEARFRVLLTTKTWVPTCGPSTGIR